ncbi:MAG TPA: type II toxin-antitoxin system PemK/MazF family toxin [Candidatus Cybelea sp.]|nr:type II toxin-antitoxin system PemK/MazF family toxin [Candidatus Cybelea sp.]
MVAGSPLQDEIWLVSLGPTQGSEMRKTRPCLVISPDEMNRHLRTVLIAPMTTVERPYPTRVSLTFHGKHGQVALDQIRAVDRQRLVRRIGKVSATTAQAVSTVLVEMFSRATLTSP